MVLGDPATFMTSLCKGLQGYSCTPDWVDTLKERDIEKEKANRYNYVHNPPFQVSSTVEGICTRLLVC